VATPGGVQIFKIDDVRDEKTLTLQEATAEISQILKTEQAKKEAGKVADNDRVKARRHGVSNWRKKRRLGQETKLFAAGKSCRNLAKTRTFTKSLSALDRKTSARSSKLTMHMLSFASNNAKSRQCHLWKVSKIK
jgi:hypothetical protein